MDIDTVEICWGILHRYIKSTDESHAVSHLVSEIIDSGIQDEDLKRLAAIDELFADAVAEHKDNNDDYWFADEDTWE